MREHFHLADGWQVSRGYQGADRIIPWSVLMALRLLLGFAIALLIVGFGLAWLPLGFIAAGLCLTALALLIEFDEADTKVDR